MIDFHAHLDLYSDPHAISRECIARGIYVLSVTTTPSAWAGTMGLTRGAPRIRTALGLHPQVANERKMELAQFERLLPQVRYVGEIGLDGGPEYRSFWTDQQKVLSSILGMCQQVGGRIMTIHSRRAVGAVLDFLEDYPGAGIPIMHWFSGTERELNRAVQLGCWFSVGPAMLGGEKGRKLAAAMPRDRILTESDGPFAQFNGRPAFPWDVVRAVEALAQLWSEPVEIANKQLFLNLRVVSSEMSQLAP